MTGVVLTATMLAMAAVPPTGAARQPARYEHLLNRARLVAAGKAADSLADHLGGGPRTIAVLPLQGDPAGVARRLFTIAAANRGITVVLRDDLPNVLREHEFTSQYTDVFQPETVRGLGRVLGADTVVFGSVSELGLLGGRGHVRLTLAAADVETATVAWGDSVTATSDEPWPAQSRPTGSVIGRLAAHWPLPAGAGGVLSLLTVLAARRRSRRRARRRALAGGLTAACTGPPDPVRGLLDRASLCLRRAQMHLADRGEVDRAAAVLDERVRLERLVRALRMTGGWYDLPGLFSVRPAQSTAGASGAEPLAEEILRLAEHVENEVHTPCGDLPGMLADIRRICRRLASSLASSPAAPRIG